MLIVDRLESSWAVIEYERKTFNLPVALLPAGIKAGDVIDLKITVDKEATQDRAERVKIKARDLFED